MYTIRFRVEIEVTWSKTKPIMLSFLLLSHTKKHTKSLTTGTKPKNSIFLNEKNTVFSAYRKLISIPGTLSAGTALHERLRRRAVPAGSYACSERRSRQLHSTLHSNQFSIYHFLS